MLALDIEPLAIEPLAIEPLAVEANGLLQGLAILSRIAREQADEVVH